jgi:hypothetical protein
LLRKAGPATTDCAMRRNRVTINYDGSVSLCCATYDRDKIIVDDFLTASRSTVDAAKYAHPFCETCMMLHVNKVYTVMNRTQQNEAAAEILGPIFQMYVNESRLIGDPDVVVLDNVFEAKTHVFERGMAALSCGEAGWDETERCFTALVKGAPDFAEGFFQAARLARARGQFGTARSHAAEAVRLHPGRQVYLEFAGDLFASSS